MPPAVLDGFRFGRFALDLRERELLRDDVRLRLADQPFDVLRVLLQHGGSLVTREDLRRELWRDGTFVDFEHGLNAAVKRLRAAIGDNAEDPTFIETLPRRGYRFIARVEPIGAQALRPRAASLPRLAVLPFTAVGEDKATAFTEGLSEELTTTLGRVFGNRVGILARFSVSRAAREHPLAPREIGRALSADFIMDGAVRQDGERVRVTARLIDARAETQLWAGAFERSLADWFAVQRDVAAEIARSLAVELLPRQASACGAPITRDTAAHHAYLKGRYYWNLPGPNGLKEAVDFYEQAIAIDPNFSAALSSLARCWVSMADYYLLPPKGALERARDAARRAIEIDEADAEAHIALGDVYRSLEWDWPSAEREYRFAMGSNPSHEAAYRLSGLLLAASGRHEEARELVQRAWQLDPLCLVVNTTAAWAHYLSADHDAAIERCLHVIDMND
ncbi:MAG TPA: winged helix-turn-helix domain-containing protein, partial [Vicinamibacterales bacterium]|nr:winged helix-turn-helix domain-containing protein [Vicinamibacterales bacterium]